jgi:divalent metal cation (Fe/Co/Zn/Cd) transporter
MLPRKLEGMAVLDVARGQQVQMALRYEWFTVGWNMLEGVVAVLFGLVASSIALVGFGLDSFIEVSSGTIMLWRLWGERNGAPMDEAKERLAIRLIGVSLLTLAAYVVWQAVADLITQTPPEASPPGIVLALVSLIVMPWLVQQKRGVARRLNSGALMADSTQTLVCTYLSAILLGGLVANALVGWWWADPIGAIAMSALIVREGYHAVTKQDICCD